MEEVSESQGFRSLWVTIDSIGDDGIAQCRDQYGKWRQIRTDQRRGGGPLPRVGEVWVIDRDTGQWGFSTLMLANPPTITGSTDGIPALVNLLSALEEMGLIVNETTDDRIRSDQDHTHP